MLGRLIAEAVKGLLIATAIVLLGARRSASRSRAALLGFVLLVALTALWAVVYAGFMQLIALKTRSAAATNSGGLIFFPLLFLTPNFVPRDLLTRPMEIAATFNPVTYVMEALRSLILEDLAWGTILLGFAVVAVARRDHARPQRPDDPPLRLTPARPPGAPVRTRPARSGGGGRACCPPGRGRSPGGTRRCR